jgi:hypothetical protein
MRFSILLPLLVTAELGVGDAEPFDEDAVVAGFVDFASSARAEYVLKVIARMRNGKFLRAFVDSFSKDFLSFGDDPRF